MTILASAAQVGAAPPKKLTTVEGITEYRLDNGLKVLLFPDGDDPDSYAKKVSNQELKSFIKQNSKDFISFKTKLLYSDTENDPIKKASLGDVRKQLSSKVRKSFILTKMNV